MYTSTYIIHMYKCGAGLHTGANRIIYIFPFFCFSIFFPDPIRSAQLFITAILRTPCNIHRDEVTRLYFLYSRDLPARLATASYRIRMYCGVPIPIYTYLHKYTIYTYRYSQTYIYILYTLVCTYLH